MRSEISFVHFYLSDNVGTLAFKVNIGSVALAMSPKIVYDPKISNTLNARAVTLSLIFLGTGLPANNSTRTKAN